MTDSQVQSPSRNGWWPQSGEPAAVKIVGIGGSLRANSYSYQALELAIKGVAQLGATVQILDLRQMTLPFCQGSGDYEDYPDVARLRETVKAADGLILATPEYHGSISGVLKNALDLMSFEHLENKVVGAISVLGGENNSNALNDLRLISRWVHAWVIPEQIAIGRAWQAFDEQGQIKNEKLRNRFNSFAQSLVENTCKLRGLMLPSAKKTGQANKDFSAFEY
jgi:NAD(P)H-dependent FMN reductase